MYKGSGTRSLIDTSKIATQKQNYANKLVRGCLIELNTKKTELIQIMNDYLTQKITRIETTNKLDILNSKIA